MLLLEKYYQNCQARSGLSKCEWVNPFMPVVARKIVDFWESFHKKMTNGKNLKEKCSSNPCLKFSIKYFVNSYFIPKLLP